MSALHAGCTAHLKSRFSATSFWDEAAADGATFAILIGAMAEIILKTVPEAPPHRIGHIFCVPFPGSGEEFQRRYGVELLWQGYGMTEVYTHPMPRADGARRALRHDRPAGRPGWSTASSTSTTSCCLRERSASSSSGRRCPARDGARLLQVARGDR